MVTSPAHSLSNTFAHARTHTRRQDDWSGLQRYGFSLSNSEFTQRGITSAPHSLHFELMKSLLCCGTHFLVKHHKSYSPGSPLWCHKTHRCFLSLFCCCYCSPSHMRIRKGCGCRTTDYTSSFCDFSVQAWSLTSGKGRRRRTGGYTRQDQNYLSPQSSTCSLLYSKLNTVSSYQEEKFYEY